jgi:citrate lyase subunit beta / citryl-CoA lyase
VSVEPAPTTLLFVPGDRPERFDKAVASGADAVIIDLEDSVPAANKATARSAAVSWLASNQAFVRVNPARTDECAADLRMLSSAKGVSTLVLPKAESPGDIDHLLEQLELHPQVVALIESAAGLAAAAAIAAHPAVALLAFGNLDFAADCRMTVEGPLELELLPARAQLTYASRAAGLRGPIDGVTPDVSNDDAALEDSLRAARLGFSGKLCVHPRQVPVVAGAFAPSSEQIDWAKRILASVAEGVALVDGAMVDRPVILRARNIMGRAGRRG